MDIETFKQKYPTVELEQFSDLELVEDEEGNEFPVEITYYSARKIPFLDDLVLRVEQNDFARLDAIIQSKPQLCKEFLGAKVGTAVEVVLSRVAGTHQFGIMGFAMTRPEPIKISTQHNGRPLQINIYLGGAFKTDMGFLASRMIGISGHNRVIATVNGLIDSPRIEVEAKHILRSVLFDIEFTYSLALETASLENLKRRQVLTRKPKRKLPSEEIQLVVKPYVPELIEYYHTAERVDYVPFKFICYFHIVEYFMDKSAHRVISKKIKQIMMRPDFHVSHSEHLNEAIKIFRTETEKNMTDKIKINRVLSEYVQRDELKQFVEKSSMASQFTKEHTLDGARPLRIHPISFESHSSFIDSLSKRIYSIRCSIVHSNPDFDESKDVPFHPSPKNIDFLRGEVELMREISNKIILNSVE